MHHHFAFTLTVALSLSAASVFAQPAPVCGPMAALVFEAGCDGPPRTTCDTGASLPAGSEWCACDGHTVGAFSMAPPTGLRYRFRGACEVGARFELTDEHLATGARTGRVVVFIKVGSGIGEVTRVQGPCRGAAAMPGELGRVACGRSGTALVIRQQGDDVVVFDGARELSRTPTPRGQRVHADELHRF